MARGDYTPEVKSAMEGRTGPPRPGQGTRIGGAAAKESMADMQRDASSGIKEGSAQDQKLDAMPGNQQRAPASIQVHRAPNDAHHVAAATSIAHAILGNSRAGSGGGGGRIL